MFKYIFLFFCFILFTNCDNNIDKVKELYKTSFVPNGQADSINVVYTDSGAVKSILKSKKMLDFSTIKNPYVEFPEGVLVVFYDNEKTTTVKADRAISYKKTEIIDLQGNVEIITFDKKILKTSQLYFDQKNEWFFSDEFFKFSDENGGYLEGKGIDFSKDFKVFNMQNNTGAINNVE